MTEANYNTLRTLREKICPETRVASLPPRRPISKRLHNSIPLQPYIQSSDSLC